MNLRVYDYGTFAVPATARPRGTNEIHRNGCVSRTTLSRTYEHTMNKNSGTIWRWLALAPALAVLFASMPAVARADDQTPPAVARISVIAGDVVVRRGDSGSDVAANVNAPLMADDYLSTRGDGRAEVQMDATDA